MFYRKTFFQICILLLLPSFYLPFTLQANDLEFIHLVKKEQIVFNEESVVLRGKGLEKIKTVLILFFDHTNTIQKRSMVYSNVLWKKYKDKGLFVLWIPANPRGIENLKRKAGLSVPVYIDEDHQVHKRYSIGKCCGGILVAGKHRKIVFRDNKLIDPESMRLLIEMQLLGTINHDFGLPVDQKFFVLNRQTPSLELTVPQTKKSLDIGELRGEHIILTFFSYVCGVCKSGKRAKTLENIRSIASKRMNGKTTIHLIFSNIYNPSDLEEWEKRIHLPFNKFFAKDIFTLEEKYITDDDLKNDPLTVVLDKHKRVIFIEQPGMTEEDVFNAIESILIQDGG